MKNFKLSLFTILSTFFIFENLPVEGTLILSAKKKEYIVDQGQNW